MALSSFLQHSSELDPAAGFLICQRICSWKLNWGAYVNISEGMAEAKVILWSPVAEVLFLSQEPAVSFFHIQRFHWLESRRSPSVIFLSISIKDRIFYHSWCCPTSGSLEVNDKTLSGLNVSRVRSMVHAFEKSHSIWFLELVMNKRHWSNLYLSDGISNIHVITSVTQELNVWHSIKFHEL